MPRPVPSKSRRTVGWLACGKDAEGNLVGFMRFDQNAK